MSEEVPVSSSDSVYEGLDQNAAKVADTKTDEETNSGNENHSSKKEEITSEEKSHCNLESPTEEVNGSSKPNSLVDNEARLEQLEKEHETLKSQYMRIAADFDNFRKRQSRDQDDLRLQLTCSTLSEILPVVDNFERARQQLEPEGEEAQALHRSYQGLYKQLVDVLKQLGVAPMRVVGEVFDPTLHEAVLREPNEQQPEDKIIEELQRGYHLNGRVLRHALVKVSMGPVSSKVDTDISVDISKKEEMEGSQNED